MGLSKSETGLVWLGQEQRAHPTWVLPTANSVGFQAFGSRTEVLDFTGVTFLGFNFSAKIGFNFSGHDGLLWTIHSGEFNGNSRQARSFTWVPPVHMESMYFLRISPS